MEIERRERDPDTGEMAPSEAGAGAFGFGSLVGEGFGDVIGKIAAKLTGKTAKKLATKAAEKLVEKGAEKIGEKTGQLVGEKIYDKFSTKPSPATEDRPPEIKGKEIGKMLAASSPPAEASRPGSFTPEKKATERKFQKINNVYADLL